MAQEEDLRRAVDYLLELREETRRIVSHDLRSPLAVVMGQAELLQAGIGGPKSLEAIVRQAERMTKMLSELGDRIREPIPGLVEPPDR